MQLQLPTAVHRLQLAASSLLGELQQQGLSSMTRLLPWQHGQQAASPNHPAFSLLQPAAEPQRCTDGSWGTQGSGAGTGPALLQTQLLPAVPAAASQQRRVQAAVTAADAATLAACHKGLCQRALQLQAQAADVPEPQQKWHVHGGSGLLLPAMAACPLLPARSAAASAVDEGALDQALARLRQLREAAMQLGRATAEGKGTLACERQQRAEERQAQVQRLALATRHALAAIPVLLQ